MCSGLLVIWETKRWDSQKKRTGTETKRTGERSSEDINVFVFLIVWGWDRDEIFYIFLYKKIPQPRTCFHVTLTCILVEYLLQFQTLIYINIYIYIYNEINTTFWRPLNVYKYNTCNVINSFNLIKKKKKKLLIVSILYYGWIEYLIY